MKAIDDLKYVRGMLEKLARPEMLEDIDNWIIALESGQVAKVEQETVEGVLAVVSDRPLMRTRLAVAAEQGIEREIYVEAVVIPQLYFDLRQVRQLLDPVRWPRVEKYYEFVMAEERANGATGRFPAIDPDELAEDGRAMLEVIPKRRRLLRKRVEDVLASLGYGTDPADSFDDDMQALVDGDAQTKITLASADDGTGLPDFEDDDELAELV